MLLLGVGSIDRLEVLLVGFRVHQLVHLRLVADLNLEDPSFIVARCVDKTCDIWPQLDL